MSVYKKSKKNNSVSGWKTVRTIACLKINKKKFKKESPIFRFRLP